MVRRPRPNGPVAAVAWRIRSAMLVEERASVSLTAVRDLSSALSARKRDCACPRATWRPPNAGPLRFVARILTWTSGAGGIGSGRSWGQCAPPGVLRPEARDQQLFFVPDAFTIPSSLA